LEYETTETSDTAALAEAWFSERESIEVAYEIKWWLTQGDRAMTETWTELTVFEESARALCIGAAALAAAFSVLAF